MDTYYSSCWLRIQLRFKDYQGIPLVQAVAVPELPTGDPVSNAGFYELDLQVIPYTCKITLNSYRQADECELSIPYTLCPLDPRVIRQATVECEAARKRARPSLTLYIDANCVPSKSVHLSRVTGYGVDTDVAPNTPVYRSLQVNSAYTPINCKPDPRL